MLSGNPVDHLVHRHTHRVTRGALVAVGRPDGRLSALTSAEAAVMLSINQASSIQNFGVTCESISLGHNPASMPLTQCDLVLPTRRPLFLTEAKLVANLGSGAMRGTAGSLIGAMSDARARQTSTTGGTSCASFRAAIEAHAAEEDRRHKQQRRASLTQARLRKGIADGVDGFGGEGERRKRQATPISPTVAAASPGLFVPHGGTGSPTETPGSTPSGSQHDPKIPPRSLAPLVVGAWMLDDDVSGEEPTYESIVRRQHLMQALYESRLASLQRLVSFMILFHRMGKQVQDFWAHVSCGLLAYDMSRTQSIMRVASTAAPVSGSEVRRRMVELGNEEIHNWATHQIREALRLYTRLRRRIASQKASDTLGA